MNKSEFTRPIRTLCLFGVATLFTVTTATAQVAAGTTGIDASGDYRREVQSCLSGNTQQDQATCLKEARNALADRKRGALNNSSSDFAANALARCDAQAGDEKLACQGRVMGRGTTSGSVAGGGVLREIVTIVPADAP